MIFAQEYVAPAALTSWVECAFYIVAFIGACGLVYRMFWPKKEEEKEIKPQPLLIKTAEEFVTKREFTAHVGDVNKKLEEMGKEAIAGRRRLHEDIQKMPKEIIEILRVTKGLL